MPTDQAAAKEQPELMKDIKTVIEYSGLNYYQVLELPVDIFALMRKNYICDLLNQTEKGREYLDQCNRIKVTETDLDGLRRIKGSESKK